MALTDLVIPIVQTIFVLLFVGIFCFVIYKGTFGRNRNWIFWIRYEVFKKKISEDLIELCINAIEEGKSEIELSKEEMLKKGYTKNQTEELIYVYNLVKKTIGGKNAK